MPRLIIAKFISLAEEDLILSGLKSLGEPAIAKIQLQRLCELLEHGSFPKKPHELRPFVFHWLWQGHALVRRWCYKTLALLSEASDSTQIAARLKSETDGENKAWGVAALARLSSDLSVQEICLLAELPLLPIYELAACTFERDESEPLSCAHVRVNLDASDALTLKWVALLEGYGRLPDGVVGGVNGSFAAIAALNRHDVADVAEYSVWAMTKSPPLVLRDLGLRTDEFEGRPAQVRRWLNRFLTKTSRLIAENLDLVRQASRDAEEPPREGLALGLVREYSHELRDVVLAMFQRELSPTVRRPLLEHMARFAAEEPMYEEIVETEFGTAEIEGDIRKHILAATGEGPLFGKLNKIVAKERLLKSITETQAFEGEPRPLFGDIIMAGPVFHGPVTAHNLVVGDMINSVNETINALGSDRSDEARAYREIIDLLPKSPEIAQEQKDAIASAVRAAAQQNSQKSKLDLVTILRAACTGVGAASALARGLEMILPHIHHLG